MKSYPFPYDLYFYPKIIFIYAFLSILAFIPKMNGKEVTPTKDEENQYDLLDFMEYGYREHHLDETASFPRKLEAYKDSNMTNLGAILKHRIQVEPFNLVATIIFLCAIIHTFLANRFNQLSYKIKMIHEQKLKELQKKGRDVQNEDGVAYTSFWAELFHFFGEVEAVFGIWVIPLIIAIVIFYDWKAVFEYIDFNVTYTEPVFVVVIMAIASTKPILGLAESSMRLLSSIGKSSPGAWWFSILTIGPLLGSFITEPAAMTIAALLLSKQFYIHRPSNKLKYATLGLLFVNVSVGGTLTHFSAPPVLMVANIWDWSLSYMFLNFGWRAVCGILFSNSLYFFIFRKEFRALSAKHEETLKDYKEVKTLSIPFFITLIHIFFLIWTVVNLHHPPLFVGGFLFFLAFTQATAHYQYQVRLRQPLLVGFFLAGLVTHGDLQQWWIEPVLKNLSNIPLFLGATVLTAFNDNSAITYLASLVPSFTGNFNLQHAVVAGAVTGGGLTVIANAPNPAGQSILSHFFPEGVSPLKVFLGAITPTIIMGTAFMLWA